MTVNACVCVPARNEAEHIGNLIAALAVHRLPAPLLVALCVNNSTDDTAAIAARAADAAHGRVTLEIVEKTFEPRYAHAGSARRAAMDLGAALLPDKNDLLISTDADCRPPADWVANNIACAGLDTIIGGRITIDQDEKSCDARIAAFRARFDAYWEAVREIEDRIDPVPWDPAPRHGDHTGASLALSVDLYQRAGGVPPLSTGEDRALVEAAVAAGGRLIHPTAVWTRTSARTAGRAIGGMAEDIRSWLDLAERGEAPRVPAFSHWAERAEWRRQQRTRANVGAIGIAERELAPMPHDMALPEL